MADSESTLLDLLRGADQAHIEAAARQVVAVATDFADEADLIERLLNAGVANETILELQTALETNPGALDAAALAVLSLAWAYDENRSIVEGAIAEAKTKLPVIEVGLLTIALIYGIHSYYTNGKKKETVIIRRDAAGNVETTIETEWADVGAPIRGIVDALTAGLTPRRPDNPSVPPNDELP